MKRLIPIGIPSENMLMIRLSKERIADAVPTESGETNSDATIQYKNPTILNIATPIYNQKLPLMTSWISESSLTQAPSYDLNIAQVIIT